MNFKILFLLILSLVAGSYFTFVAAVHTIMTYSQWCLSTMVEFVISELTNLLF